MTIAKKSIPISLLFPALGAVISYAAYAVDLAVSAWPWKIGVAITFACPLSIIVVGLMDRHKNSLLAHGMILIIGIFGVYYFFGIFAYFCYFAFAPMPLFMHWCGLIGGVVLTGFWMLLIYKDVSRVIKKTTFVVRAFEEREGGVFYDIQRGMREFERRYKERSPFPKIFAYIVLGLAPFCLILQRILSETFGANGVLIFLAILGMPLSLWLAGLLVRIFLMMIVLPRQIQRERNKIVIAVM